MGVRASKRGGLLGFIAAVCALLGSAPADAEPLGARGFGIFLGYNWGEPKGVEWGFETLATYHFQQQSRCSSEPRAGLGPVLRVTMVGSSQLALTGALHLGAESERSVLAFDGELGGTLASGAEGLRAGLHTGALIESLVFGVYARQDWLMRSYSMGGGFRYQPTFGELGYCSGGG